MTHSPPVRGGARRRTVLVPFLVVALALGACSNDDPGADGGAGTTTSTVVATDEWLAAVEDPCVLLEVDEIAAAFDVERVALLPDPTPGTCGYLVEPNATVTVTLHRPQASPTSANRTAGTRTVQGSESTELLLRSSGVSLFAREGRALAQVTARYAVKGFAVTPGVLEQVDELAAAVRSRLPKAPTPGPAVDDRDLCDLAPIDVLGEGFVAAEPQATFACAYEAGDGTVVGFGWRTAADEVPAGSLLLPGGGVETEPWEGAGEGATWISAPAESGDAGSGRGEVVIDAEHALVVEVTSPARTVEELEALATEVAVAVRDAAGG